MRKVTSGLAAVALIVLACLAVGGKAGAGAPEGAVYAGSKLCIACHKGTQAEAVAGWEQSAHSRALWPIEAADDTHVVVADFSLNPPFARDRIAFVLGSGVRQQAYLDKELKLLPGRWLVKEKKWAPQTALDARSDCLGCHTTAYDPGTAQWKEPGVGCEMCHGPGSVHAASQDKKGTIVRLADLDPARQAMVCGQCHSVGHSSDGRYTFPAGFVAGDDLDKLFTLAPGVQASGMNAQYNDLRLGGGKHLASGTVCTTCHEPHRSQPPSLRVQGNELCLQCHAGKLTGAQHSEATLKAVQCTVCHMPGGRHLFVPGTKK
jgi:predicted CXXCH cytochrome family protein